MAEASAIRLASGAVERPTDRVKGATSGLAGGGGRRRQAAGGLRHFTVQTPAEVVREVFVWLDTVLNCSSSIPLPNWSEFLPHSHLEQQQSSLWDMQSFERWSTAQWLLAAAAEKEGQMTSEKRCRVFCPRRKGKLCRLSLPLSPLS